MLGERIEAMSKRHQSRYKQHRPSKTGGGRSVDDIVSELRRKDASAGNYRERSLRRHGLICAKCGREFNYKNRRLLTVHHKDGNPRNNPADGSNWENLCLYCHEDEHSRGLLADYLREDDGDEP